MKILDRFDTKFQLDEQTGEGILRMKMAVAQADVATGNGRCYPEDVLRDSAKRFNARLAANRSMFGAAGHPARGESLDVKDVSHRISGVELDKDGKLIATVDVIPTHEGKNVAAIIKAGGRLGVSLRGRGSVKNEDGKEIVLGDYELEGIDFCISPAGNFFAGREHVFESQEVDELEEVMSNDEIHEKYLAAVKNAGFKLDEQTYRRAFSATRKALHEGATSPVPDLPGLEAPEPEKPEPETSPAADIVEALAKVRPSLGVMRIVGDKVLAFDVNLSECYFCDYRRENGKVRLGNLRRMEV